MSREVGAVVNGRKIRDWVMICNGCWSTRSDPRPNQRDLPLEEFRDAGWMIGRVRDYCPTCVDRCGGLVRAAREVEAHAVMAPLGGVGLLHSPELWASA